MGEEDQDQARPRASPKSVLNEDHYGLDKVKDRILEYLAVQQRVDKVKSPILCLVGTSGRRQDLARPERWRAPPAASSCAWRSAAFVTRPRSAAIAAPTIGSMPGKVLQSLSKVGTRRTRCSFSTRSTSSAWTSAVTPRARFWKCSTRSRTTRFSDHYVEVDFRSVRCDVSSPLSNSMNIPPAHCWIGWR